MNREPPNNEPKSTIDLKADINEFLELFSDQLAVSKKELIELALQFINENEEVKTQYNKFVRNSTPEPEFEFDDPDDDWDEDDDLNEGLDPTDLPGTSPTPEDEEFAREQTESESWDDMMDDIDSLGEEDG